MVFPVSIPLSLNEGTSTYHLGLTSVPTEKGNVKGRAQSLISGECLMRKLLPSWKKAPCSPCAPACISHARPAGFSNKQKPRWGCASWNAPPLHTLGSFSLNARPKLLPSVIMWSCSRPGGLTWKGPRSDCWPWPFPWFMRALWIWGAPNPRYSPGGDAHNYILPGPATPMSHRLSEGVQVRVQEPTFTSCCLVWDAV